MATYVAFLRAINLGPTRRLPMAEVRSLLEGAGYVDVATHLATGNVRVGDPRGRDAEEVRTDVARRLGEHAGFDVPVVLCDLQELRTVSEESRSLDDGPAGRADKRHVAFLPTRPDDAAAAELATWSVEHPGEGVHLGARHLHWWLDGSTADAVIFAPRTLRRLGIPGATTRTRAVVDALVTTWC